MKRSVIIIITISVIVALGIINPYYLLFFAGYFLAVLFNCSGNDDKLLHFCIYSTIIWDNETRTIIDGDYDVVEIREGTEIKDYNAVISKVIAYLYNQIKRRKPIGEIIVRIAGNPPLSESTKRLLEERFLEVEFLEFNYRKLNYTL